MGASRYARYKGLVVALIVTAALQATIIVRSPTITADGIIFISIARQLPDGAVEAFRKQDQHPGYPAMLLGATRVAQDLGVRAEPESWMLGGQIVSFACGLLTVSMVWLLGRELFDARAANVAALIFAVLPVARGNAADAVSDTPHLAFYLLAAWLATVGIGRGRTIWLAAAGAVSGLAYWIRPEGLEVVIVACVFLVFHARRTRWGFRRFALAEVALIGSALIVAMPYLVLAGKVTSKQLTFAKYEPTPMHIEQLAQVNVPAEPVATSATLPTVEQIGSNPAPLSTAAPAVVVKTQYTVWLVAKLVGEGIMALLNSIGQGFKWVFLPFYVLGHLELARRRPNWLQIRYVVYFGALHCLILLAVFVISGYIGHRHLLPLIALAMPCTALGVIYVAEIVVRRYQARPAFAVWGIAGLSCALVLPYTIRPFSREFIPVIAATHWVEQRAEPGAGIVSNSPYVAFHGALPVSQLGNHASRIDEALAHGKPRHALRIHRAARQRPRISGRVDRPVEAALRTGTRVSRSGHWRPSRRRSWSSRPGKPWPVDRRVTRGRSSGGVRAQRQSPVDDFQVMPGMAGDCIGKCPRRGGVIIDDPTIQPGLGLEMPKQAQVRLPQVVELREQLR